MELVVQIHPSFILVSYQTELGVGSILPELCVKKTETSQTFRVHYRNIQFCSEHSCLRHMNEKVYLLVYLKLLWYGSIKTLVL